jgi:hypothetical protein
MLVTRALEQLMQKKGGGGSCSGSSTGKKTGGKGDRVKPNREPDGDRNKRKRKGKFDITKVRCYNCNEKGHFQSDCPEPKKEKANLAEGE